MIPGDGAGRITHRTDGVVHDLVPEIPAARMENLANAFSDMAGVNGYELMQRSKGAEISISVRTTAGQRQRKALRFHGRRRSMDAPSSFVSMHQTFSTSIKWELNQASRKYFNAHWTIDME